MIFKALAMLAFIFVLNTSLAADNFVRSIQNELNSLGYNVGSIDGIAGSNTVSAIRQFYLSTGIDWRGPVVSENLDYILKMKSILGDELKITNIEPSNYIQNNFFESPEFLCKSLEAVDIKTGGWKRSNSIPGEWICLSEYFRFGNSGPSGLENNIAYYVYGNKIDRAKEVVVKLNINNSAQQIDGLNKFKSIISYLSDQISFDVLGIIEETLNTGVSSDTKTSFGKMTVDVDKDQITSYTVRLLDRNYLEAQDELMEASVSGFDFCISVVSDAINYSEDDLNGGGIPVIENGYDSFLINGRGKDLFFCELYKSGEYKIKAAINGRFPFKYIANGSLGQ